MAMHGDTSCTGDQFSADNGTKGCSYKYPEELNFLLSPECNPDWDDEEIMKQGCVRTESRRALHHSSDQTTRTACLRRIMRVIIYSSPVQTLVLLVICFDCVLTVISLFSAVDDDAVVFSVSDWLTVIVLSFDVLGRLFVESWKFFKSCMNIFELFLVPLTIVEVIALKNAEIPLPLLRVLRPLFRAVRLVRVIMRGMSKREQYKSKLRQQLSGDRIRFQQEGFDLDLAYISDQIIAMSTPAVGENAWMHNSVESVACFLNERHPGKYLVVNLANEIRYPTDVFFHRCLSFPMAQNSVPGLQDLHNLCRILDGYLRYDDDHRLAIHSKFAQGRCAIVIIGLLIYRGVYRSPASAIAYYEQSRVCSSKRGLATTQTFDCASQRRFLEYFACLCRIKQTDQSNATALRHAALKSIRVVGIPSPRTVDVHVFSHTGTPIAVFRGGRDSDLEDEDYDEELGTGAGAANAAQQAGDDGGQAGRGIGSGYAKMVLERSAYGTVTSGTAPLLDRPVLSSFDRDRRILADEACHRSGVGLVAQPANLQDTHCCTWTAAVDGALEGEFRIELHRRQKVNSESERLDSSAKKNKKTKKSLRPKKRWWCCLGKRGRAALQRFKRGAQNSAARERKGLLFATWLHTAFLEYDEPSRNSAEQRRTSRTLVRVCLDRFNLDKGVGAMPLHEHSTDLKLELEFDVARRMQWRALSEAAADDDGELISSSLNTSESYSLGWITWVAHKIWPSVEGGFRKLISESLISSLQEHLPVPFNRIRLASFSLGDATPQFGPLVASTRNVEGLEVQLDIGIAYAADTDIVLDVGIAPCGIRRLQIDGVLSVKFRPILQEMPVFASMQLLFVNPPKLDLVFGRSMEIVNLSSVKNYVFGAINKGLADVMVLPNVVTINWADPANLSDSAVSFDTLMPVSIVRISVLRGKDLCAFAGGLSRVPNVYAKVDIGDQTMETKFVNFTSDPMWGDESDFLIYDERQHFSLRVLDLGFAKVASEIGQVTGLSVASLAAAGREGMWVKLKDTPNSAPSQVHLRASMFDLHASSTQIEELLRSATEQEDFVQISTNRNSTSTPSSPPHLRSDKKFDAKSSFHQFKGHPGAVALFVCQVHGGRMADLKADAAGLKVEVSLGAACSTTACSEALPSLDLSAMDVRTQEVIKRMAEQHIDPDVIAHTVGEEPVRIQRIMRKYGWTLECKMKASACCTLDDLVDDPHVRVGILDTRSKQRLGSCKIPLHTILNDADARHSEIVRLSDEFGNPVAELDIEVRLYALERQTVLDRNAMDTRDIGGASTSASPPRPPPFSAQAGPPPSPETLDTAWNATVGI
eukprot:TRINITY_DN26189_c0_g1_i3.p1 TRINITY_DN26189_c0_g1~~TRINITY_DN26189_c0_g1_i3.p1  ORF type:complete len:1324 (+),score=243.08 TRINITY_DN26189_c0_g1_i3:62-4033(+)